MITPRLPRQIETDPRNAAVEAALTRDLRPLWERGNIKVAHVPFTEAFEKTLGYALRDQHLARGLDNIERLMNAERKGLSELREKDGSAPANRASRLLVIPNGCTERFYRTCEALLFNHSDRLLGLRVDIDHEKFAENIFREGELVKVLLLTDRDAVAQALLTLA